MTVVYHKRVQEKLDDILKASFLYNNNNNNN